MTKITLVLHNIRSAHNVGAIFRTAEGFGVTNIILSGYTPAPIFPGDRRLPHIAAKIDGQIHKTALGAEHLVPFEVFENFNEWRTSSSAPILIGLEQAPGSVNLRDFVPPAEFALVLGEEVDGIHPDILSECDHTVEIPMAGQKESFNVSVAAGIALFALTR